VAGLHLRVALSGRGTLTEAGKVPPPGKAERFAAAKPGVGRNRVSGPPLADGGRGGGTRLAGRGQPEVVVCGAAQESLANRAEGHAGASRSDPLRDRRGPGILHRVSATERAGVRKR